MINTDSNENMQKRFEQAESLTEKLALLAEAKSQQEEEADIELSLDDLDSVSGGNGYWYNEPNPEEILLNEDNLEGYYIVIRDMFEWGFPVETIIGFADQITNGAGAFDNATWLLNGGAEMWKDGWQSVFAGTYTWGALNATHYDNLIG